MTNSKARTIKPIENVTQGITKFAINSKTRKTTWLCSIATTAVYLFFKLNN